MTRTRKRMGNAVLGSRMNEQNEPKRIGLDDDSIINSTMDTGDSFSKFPESLMLRILFFLPARDAARTSLLSKTWRRLWSSLPTQSFKFDYDSFRNNYVPEEGENLGSEEMLDKFIMFVDDSLFRIRGEKIKIESFLLHLPRYQHKLQTHTNQWIELVTKNPIKELEICSDSLHVNIERYVLPRAISIAKSLTTLNLTGLKLNETILAGDSKFPCLRSISLLMVNLSRETAENLVSSCPLLEQLELELCVGLTHLCIPNLPMLKKVSININFFDGIVVDAANLETLDYTFFSSEWDLDAIACNNLKELRVRSDPTTINQHVEEILSKFLLLETLYLDYTVLPHELPYSIRIIIASHQLKRLNLVVSGDPQVIKIYAPNLKSYEYLSTNLNIPSILFTTASSLEWAELSVYVEDIVEIDTAWFIKLLKYLTVFKNHEYLNLYISSNSSISFNPMEWRRYAYQLPTVDDLTLEMTLEKQHYEALLEGLLSVCHPQLICAVLKDEGHRDLAMHLYNFFSRRNSSWDLHGLKEATILGLEVDDEMESFLTLGENKYAKFKLTW